MNLLDTILNQSKLDKDILARVVNKLDQTIDYDIKFIHDPIEMGQYLTLDDVEIDVSGLDAQYRKEQGILHYGQVSFGTNYNYQCIQHNYNKSAEKIVDPIFNIDEPCIVSVTGDYSYKESEDSDEWVDTTYNYLIIYEPIGENSFLRMENINYFLPDHIHCFSDFIIAARRTELFNSLKNEPLDQSFLIEALNSINPSDDYHINIVQDTNEIKDILTLKKHYIKAEYGYDKYVQVGFNISKTATFGEDFSEEFYSQGQLVSSNKSEKEPVFDSTKPLYAVINSSSASEPINTHEHSDTELVFYCPGKTKC